MSRQRDLLMIIPAMFLAISLAACSPQSSNTDKQSENRTSLLETIETEKSITVGWAPYAPYVSANPETREPEGYYVDLVEAMAREAEWKVQWVETTWGTMIGDIKTNKFDVMGAPVFRTIGRAKSVEFTRSIGYFGLSAVVRADDGRFSKLSDFEQPGLIVAVTQGEVGHEFAERNLPNAELVVRQSGDISLALVDVIQGRADVGIADAWTIAKFAEEHSGEVVDLFAENAFGRVGAGWFVRPGEGRLRVFLNASIDWLESSGEIDRIAKSYPNLPEVDK